MNNTELPNTGNTSYDEDNYSNSLPFFVLIFQMILVSLCCIIGVFGNAITIIAVIRFPYMRNSTNIFITNLAVAGFLVCSLIMPIFLISLSQEEWPWGEALCVLFAVVTITFFEVSLLTHLCIAVNRYVIVSKRRALTQKIFKLRNTVLICVGVWLSAVLLAMLPLMGWGSYEFQESVHMCLAKQPESLSYSWFICIICAVIPAIVIIICYIRIYVNVRASSRRLKNNESLARISYEVTGTSNCELEIPKEQESNDSVFVSKEEDTNMNPFKEGNYFQKSVKIRTSSVSFTDEKYEHNSSKDDLDKKASKNYGINETVTSTPDKSSLSKIDIIVTNPVGEEISRIWEDGELRFIVGNDDEISENKDCDSNKSVTLVEETELLQSDGNSSLQPIINHNNSSKNIKSDESQENDKTKKDKNRRASCLSASQLNCSKEVKVAVNLFVIFVVFCLLWLPWLIMLLMSIFLIPPRPYSIITMMLYFLNPSLNCLIYACRNSNFKRAFHELLCCRSKQTC